MADTIAELYDLQQQYQASIRENTQRMEQLVETVHRERERAMQRLEDLRAYRDKIEAVFTQMEAHE